MLRKKDLKPGMKVRNKESGRIGILRADSDDESKLRQAASWCVAVTTRVRAGKNAGKCDYKWWNLNNIELYSILTAQQ